jgi:septation ring formation regulator EzrA
MAQRTESDLRELKDLIQGLDKKIDLLDKKVELGFSDVNGKLDVIDTRLTTVEAGLIKLDSRLWAFIGLCLTTTLGSLLTVFIRYVFSDHPKF